MSRNVWSIEFVLSKYTFNHYGPYVECNYTVLFSSAFHMIKDWQLKRYLWFWRVRHDITSSLLMRLMSLIVLEVLLNAATFPNYYHSDVCHLLTIIECISRNVYDAATFSSVCLDQVIMASLKTGQNGRF